jgi:hypothetical protein
MNLKLKKVAPLQAGKMLAALYGLMSLIFVPFIMAFMALGSFAARQNGGAGAPALPLMFGMGIGAVIFLPVMYAVFGFIAGALGALIYNLLARFIGGFHFEFESTDEAPPPAV